MNKIKVEDVKNECSFPIFNEKESEVPLLREIKKEEVDSLHESLQISDTEIDDDEDEHKNILHYSSEELSSSSDKMLNPYEIGATSTGSRIAIFKHEKLKDEKNTWIYDGNYSKQGVDYNPGNANSSFLSNFDFSSVKNESHPESADPLEHQTGKKRTQKMSLSKRERAKKLRNQGKMYVDRKQKVHEPKRLQEYFHRCRYNCNINVSEESRQVLFDGFWKLGSWELQTAFLNGSIILDKVKRKKQASMFNKDVSCQYNLNGFRVCKDFFIKTLDISKKRIFTLIEKRKNIQTGMTFCDRRGKKEPANKISQERVDVIEEHINSFPRYSSCYSRRKHVQEKYLDPKLDVKILYKLYVSFCQDVKNVEPVKESFYRYIFKTKFKLSFHRPDPVTCTTCEKLNVTIDHTDDLEVKQKAEFEKELHLLKSAAIIEAKNDCLLNEDITKVAICFDLQKTMPSPNLTNSKTCYYRQLWTYNLNIHNLQTGVAQMYIWHEGQASRGCQEIASCLLKFIKSLPNHVKHVTVFSDNNGGQIKNHIIVKYWLFVIKNTHIESVDHRFCISGHSYNVCDQDFDLIVSKKKKLQKDLYVPEQWADLIRSFSRKFVVVMMQNEDFVSIDYLSPYFKETVPGIQDMQWLHFEKKHPFTLFYKIVKASEDSKFSTIDMKSAWPDRNLTMFPELPVITEKSKITNAKYANLMELLQFIPPIYHDFFKNLPHEDTPKQNMSQNDRDFDNDDDDKIYSTDEDL